MPIRDLFRNIQISPRVAFWVSVSALVIVLVNDHIYMASLEQREKNAYLMMQQNIAEAETLAKRERILRTWELQLIQREAEFKQMMSRVDRAKAPQ